MKSSIKENLDANYTVNFIHLSLNSPIGRDKIWVLVEGEDDCKIYPKFFKENNRKIEQVHGGCGQLEIVIEKLQKYNDKVIGIRDADFCHITNNYLPFPNMFYTDFHDIEMMMIHNDSVFKNIFYDFGLSEVSNEIKNNLLEETVFVGYIRYYNELNDCRLNFQGLSFGNLHKKNDDNSLILLKKELIDEINNRSTQKKIVIDKEIIDKFSKSVDLSLSYQLINGHDFTKLLAFRINFILTSKKLNDKEVSKSLRNSYTMNEFKQTDLFKNIQVWQHNSCVDILND